MFEYHHKNEKVGDGVRSLQQLTGSLLASLPRTEHAVEKLIPYSGTDQTEISHKAEQIHLSRIDTGYVSKEAYFIERLRSHIAQTVTELTGTPLSADAIVIDRVPAGQKGDLSISVPSMRDGNISPYIKEFLPNLEGALRHSFDSLGISDAVRIGPFLNLEINSSSFSLDVLSAIRSLGRRYGESDRHKEERILIDFGSPNLGKSLHMGHAGTLCVGQALQNILHAQGRTVYAVNHLGDWGTPIGKLKVAVEELGHGREITSYSGKELAALYSQIVVKAKEDPTLAERARDAFCRLEAGDPEMLEFWSGVRQVSLKDMEKTFERLGVTFDFVLGESFYEQHLTEVIEEALAAGIAIQGEAGAVAIDLSAQGLGSFLLRKSDGASTYQCRDIAALKLRSELLGNKMAVYVVGNEQRLNFEQVFAAATMLGYMKPGEAAHVPIGLIKQGGKKISSRDGNSLALDDMLETVTDKARGILDGRQADAEPMETAVKADIASKIGVAALFFSQVSAAPHKETDFDPKRMLDLKGKSGPYLQYTAVRAASIVRKVGEPSSNLESIDWKQCSDLAPCARKLVLELARFPEAVDHAGESLSPHHIATYLDGLAHDFNTFFATVSVKNAPPELKNIYIHIVAATETVLTNGLRLLNIEPPSVM